MDNISNNSCSCQFIQCDITPHDTTNTALVLFIRLCKCSHKQYLIYTQLWSVFSHKIMCRSAIWRFSWILYRDSSISVMTHDMFISFEVYSNQRGLSLNIGHWAMGTLSPCIYMSVGCFLKLISIRIADEIRWKFTTIFDNRLWCLPNKMIDLEKLLTSHGSELTVFSQRINLNSSVHSK